MSKTAIVTKEPSEPFILPEAIRILRLLIDLPEYKYNDDIVNLLERYDKLYVKKLDRGSD